MEKELMIFLFVWTLLSTSVIVSLIVSNRLRTTKNRDDIRRLEDKLRGGL